MMLKQSAPAPDAQYLYLLYRQSFSPLAVFQRLFVLEEKEFHCTRSMQASKRIFKINLFYILK